jgi:hypothetical protein
MLTVYYGDRARKSESATKTLGYALAAKGAAGRMVQTLRKSE